MNSKIRLIVSLKLVLLLSGVSADDQTNDTALTDTPAVSESNTTATKNTTGGSNELPYIVWVTTAGGVTELRHYNERACTGTLIRPDLVLTLATCLLLDYRDDPYPDITRVHERPSGHILPVLKIFINPNFYSEDRTFSGKHDFALILVERSKQSEYPSLPQGLEMFGDIMDTCVMGGYGADTNANIKDNFKVFRINSSVVKEYTGRACSNLEKVCLHFYYIMPCAADFGTPLICGGVVFALYSPRYTRQQYLSTKCFDFYMSTFSPVYIVKDWVEQIMEVPTSNLEWLNNPVYVLLLCCVVFGVMGGIYYGLVEFLQRTFDPAAEGLAQLPLSQEDEREEDEESCYESQWVTR